MADVQPAGWSDFHLWFAWYPVKAQGQWVWLRYVKRSFYIFEPEGRPFGQAPHTFTSYRRLR